MNDHEVERIAAAMNMLRPDWPTKQLKTLMADRRLKDRPRRDVSVALTWIACDTATHNPYRVLEAGPWWKATAVDGPTGPNLLAQKPPWCKNCGQGETATIHLDGGECEFTIWPAQAIAQARRDELIEEARRAAIEALPPPTKEPEPTPERCDEGDCIRAHGHTGPHQGPPTAALPRSPGPHEDAAVAATSEEGK